MKKLIRIGLLSLIVLALAACSGGGNGDDESNTVVVYTPHPSETVNLLVEEFQTSTGINVEIVAAGTGELLNRIAAESENAQADVMWGGGAESLASFNDYFQAYKPTGLDQVSSQFYDANNLWTGESPLPMVIMYNKNLVAEEDVPKSWADVLDPKFKGQIAMADPGSSGSAYTILVTMITAHGGDTDEGWQFATDFYKNLDGKIQSSSGNVYVGVADGEYAIGLTLEKEAIRYVLADADVGIVYPEDGTSAVPDAVAIIKDAKNLTNAQKFVEFVTSKETQELMVAELGRRPVRNDVEIDDSLPALEDIKLVDYDFDWAANHKAEIVERWQKIVIEN